MKILHQQTGVLHEATVELVRDEDWEIIRQSGQFKFNWLLEKKRIVQKIRLAYESEILGLISYEDIPTELRIHIHLIENSEANKGKKKEYDFLTGCLLARTCEIAFERKYDGFVSLEPKTALADYYKDKYGLSVMGKYLYTELSNSERLIQQYLSHEK